MAQITDQGFKLKTQNEYFEEESQLYLDIDADWNTDPSTPDGLKIAKDSETFANLDEAVQRAYNSKNPNFAKGNDLDILCAITGTKRDKGIPSRVTVTLGGVQGTTVFEGDEIESEDGTVWTIDETVNIPSGGTVNTTATATENGPIAAAVGTVNKIKTIRSGWLTVTNPSIAIVGRGRQTDPNLRRERRESVARPSSNMVESIYGNVNAVEGVNKVKIYENEKKTVDANGLPGNSMAIIVDGGDDYDVAFAIFKKRGPGTEQFQTSGAAVDQVVTSDVFPDLTKEIKYSRPNYIDAVIVVDVVDDGTLPATAGDEIKQAIIDYSNGELLPSDGGFNKLGFSIAEDVPAARIYTPVNSVLGKYGDSYVTGLTVNGGSLLTIDFDELARFGISNITVNIS